MSPEELENLREWHADVSRKTTDMSFSAWMHVQDVGKLLTEVDWLRAVLEEHQVNSVPKAVHQTIQAFYELAVTQRDQAWAENERLKDQHSRKTLDSIEQDP